MLNHIFLSWSRTKYNLIMLDQPQIKPTLLSHTIANTT